MEDDQLVLPESFELFQNYPNPFNPSTTITYSLATKTNVRLVVCDLVGRRVQTLVDEQQEPGTFRVHLGARSLSSGVYFYKLVADDFITTRKMLVLK